MKSSTTSIFLLLLTLIASNVSAQNFTISGNVKQKDDQPVAYAYISLLAASDSSRLTTVQSSIEGDFSLTDVAAGKYIVSVTALGMKKELVEVSILSNITDLGIVLSSKSNLLDEVIIEEKKDFIELKPGKLVVNINENIKVGSSLLDILRTIPGVHVSPQGDISLNNKQGVTVLINEKETFLSGVALIEYLKGLDANKVTKVEVVDQPSAKYDAEGNSGILNIVTEVEQKKGWTVTTTASYSQGRYPFVRANSNIAYTTKKARFNVVPSYYKGESFLIRNTNRTSSQDGDIVSAIEEDVFMKETFSDASLKLGVDYDLSKSTLIGVSGSGNYHPNAQIDKSYTEIHDLVNNSYVYNTTRNYRGFLRVNQRVNLFLKHKFDSSQTLKMNADYFNNGKVAYQKLRTSNKDEDGNLLPGGLDLNNDIPVKFDLYSAKVDYTSEAIDNVDIEAGVKSSYVQIDEENLFGVYDNNKWIKDTIRSNKFIYKECISAAYVSASTKVGQLEAKAGLRAEHTYSNGDQVTQSKEFTRNYLSLFPTIFTSYKLNDDYALQAGYNRRLNRPYYRELNPFTLYLSQYNYKTGNPLLQPQFTDNYNLKCNYKGKLVVTASCAFTKGVFMNDIMFDQATKVTNNSTTNNGTRREGALSAFYNNRVLDWLNVTANGTYVLFDFNGVLNGENVATGGSRYGFGLDTQVTLNKGWFIHLAANYSSKYRSGINSINDSFIYTSSDVSKSLFDDTANVKLSVQDPFNWYRGNSTYNQNGITERSIGIFNTQSVTLAFTYNIGSKEKNTRTGESPDELNRM